MDVPIEIAGLTQVIDRVSSGSLVVIKGGPDPVKTFMAHLMGVQCVKSGLKVSFVPSYDRETAQNLLDHYFKGMTGIDFVDIKDPESCGYHIQRDRALVVDSFSYLIMGRMMGDAKTALTGIRARLKETRSTAFLVLTDGMLSPEMEAVILHHADGIILLLEKESAEGVKRYLRIPRWMDGSTFDMNIYYSFNENGISVDTRYRVI